jgi:hypothetical protein
MPTGRPPLRRLIGPWLLVAGVAALALGAAIAGASATRAPLTREGSPPPPTYAPPTGFGGYQWHGNVNQIEAEWRVPAMTDTHQLGAEATWIGAQGRNPDEPFIQLGTTGFVSGSPFLGSGRGTEAETASPPSLTQITYEVFWSDTQKGFFPVPIVRLRHPGDLILFKMTRGPNGWQLNVKNLTVGWSRSVNVDYGQHDSFSQGEWMQEDPGGYPPGTDFPYANTSPVSFRRVLVNGDVPTLRYADEGALSTQNGVYLIPTSMEHDGFSLVAPTGAALQYLTDAQRLDARLSRIGAEVRLNGHDRGNADSRQVRDTAQIAALYFASVHVVETQTWPAAAHPAVLRFVRELSRLAQSLSEWAQGTQHSLSQIDAIVDFPHGELAANDLRKALGLPSI